MKTLSMLIAALILQTVAHAETITREDIRATVLHLQQRCHEAEAAQTSAQKRAVDLQGQIDALAAHDKAEADRADQAEAQKIVLQKKCDTLAGRLDKLVLALAFVGGFLVWSLASRFSALLMPPWSIMAPIAAGVAAGSAITAWLRFVL